MYINIKTNEVLTRSELEYLHRDPYVAFPDDAADEVLLEFGYANLRYQPQPSIGPDKVLKVGPIKNLKDIGYVYTWIVTDRDVARQEVDIERDIRIDSGFEFKDKTIQSNTTDRENITGAVQLAMMAVMAGAQKEDYNWMNGEEFYWITADNSVIKMDAHDVIELGRAAALNKQRLIFKSREIKDMDIIPSDYTDNKWWE